MEVLEAHLTAAGLGRFASKIIEVTHAETCADLALLDEAMVEAIIPQCGLQFVSAAKFKQCVASVALPPPLSPLGGGGGGGNGGGVDLSSARLPSARRASSYLSMEDELHELTAASAHVMSWMCSSECTLESLVDVVVDSVYKLVGCECCTLYFVDRVKAELWIAVARDKEIEGFRMPVGTGIAGKVAATCTSFNTSECKADAQWNSELDERTGFRTETMLCVPVFVPGGEAVAVLQVMNRTRPAVSSRLSSRLTIESKVAALAATAPYSFDQHDEHVLSNFGLLVALAVQKCSAELVLRKLSKDDRRGRDASTASDTSTMTAEAERLLMSQFFSHGMRDQVGRMLDDARTGSEEAPSSSSSSSVTPVAPPQLRRWPSLVEDEEDDEADGSTRADLRRWDIDIHALEDATLLRYVEIMLTEWIPPENSVPAATMRSFIMAAAAGYKNNPFHNKFHGVSVCQITYMILRSEANLASVLSPIECFAMIVAALCHDLGHPGVNNAYLVAANDPIAQRHADERDAVLERFHIANTFEILSDERCNLLATFPRKDIVVFRRALQHLRVCELRSLFVFVCFSRPTHLLTPLNCPLLSPLSLHSLHFRYDHQGDPRNGHVPTPRLSRRATRSGAPARRRRDDEGRPDRRHCALRRPRGPSNGVGPRANVGRRRASGVHCTGRGRSCGRAPRLGVHGWACGGQEALGWPALLRLQHRRPALERAILAHPERCAHGGAVHGEPGALRSADCRGVVVN